MKGAPRPVCLRVDRASRERQRDVKTKTAKTVTLGELVLTVFDKAAQHSHDAQEVSRLAAQTVVHMLLRGGNLMVSQPSRPQPQIDN
jgi:hypothetical protein